MPLVISDQTINKTYKYLDKDKILNKLLLYWLFPISIDSIFSSKLFWKLVLSDITNINLTTEEDVRWKIKPKYYYSLLPYKITRNNNAPRYLWIPHPL